MATKTATPQVIHHIGRIPVTNAAELQWFGTELAKTKFLGTITPPEGEMITTICIQQGWSLLEFAENYNVMKGRLSKKTDGISTDFDRRGGTKEIIQRTPECVEVVLALGKTKYTSKITWEDCKSEPFVYEGRTEDAIAAIAAGRANTLRIKAKYATPRSRMQMLWARAISDGVRVVSPECCCGIYTPEEVSDFDEECAAPQPAVAAPTAAPVREPTAQAVASQAQAAVDIERCPAGLPEWVGKRWDDASVFSVAVLRQALNVQHRAFTPEMKDYIRSIIAARETDAATTTQDKGE